MKKIINLIIVLQLLLFSCSKNDDNYSKGHEILKETLKIKQKRLSKVTKTETNIYEKYFIGKNEKVLKEVVRLISEHELPIDISEEELSLLLKDEYFKDVLASNIYDYLLVRYDDCLLLECFDLKYQKKENRVYFYFQHLNCDQELKVFSDDCEIKYGDGPTFQPYIEKESVSKDSIVVNYSIKGLQVPNEIILKL